MFNLLPILFTCFVFSNAHPAPDGYYNLINSGSGGFANSIASKLPPPAALASNSANGNSVSSAPQSNAVASTEDSNEAAADETPQQSANINANDNGVAAAPASASAPALAAAAAAGAPASVARLAVSAAAGANSASASASRSGLSVSSTSKSGSGGSTTTTTVQHQILPAETLPLPITISTRPGLRTFIAPETITIHEPTIAKVGEIVQKIPTSVSHQSQTVVHKHARVVTPIVAPAVRTTTSQVWRAYHTPLLLAPQTSVVRVISASGSATGSNSNSANNINNNNNN